MMSSILKEGLTVMFRMLGELRKGKIIGKRPDGNFNVKCEGTQRVIPNINWYDPKEKNKPWYIVQSGKTVRDPKADITTNTEATDLGTAVQEQKDFLRGRVKK